MSLPRRVSLLLLALAPLAAHPGLLLPLLLGVLPVMTSLTQGAFAAAFVGRRNGRAMARVPTAWAGALIGHYAWSILVLFVIADGSARVPSELAIAALLVVPAAFLGAAGAALGAVLVSPRA